MQEREVCVTNKFQKKYCYTRSQPVGKNFDPKFTPELTPQEMLELGVFGGAYFSGETPKEFPKEWFTHAKLQYGDAVKKDSRLNFFRVNASQPLSVWQQKGWIYKDDPRGWFEWYCRYYMGRRILKEDERQIKRWLAIRRHIAQLTQNCERDDFTCRPRQRQALLHWAYDSRRW